MSTPVVSPPAVSFYDASRYNAHESVGHRLFQLMNMVRRVVEVRMAEHGLTDAQWKPLWMLKEGRATTAIELARETCIDAGAITRMLDRLEAKGLVERVRSETDRRVVKLCLTPAGEVAAQSVPQVLAAVNNDFLRGFSENEWRQLLALVERMTANGQALQAETEAA